MGRVVPQLQAESDDLARRAQTFVVWIRPAGEPKVSAPLDPCSSGTALQYSSAVAQLHFSKWSVLLYVMLSILSHESTLLKVYPR